MYMSLNIHLESVQLLLSCLVAVFCLVEVSQFWFDQSVVILYRRVSVTPSSPPSDFLLSLFSLYPHFMSYCKYHILVICCLCKIFTAGNPDHQNKVEICTHSKLVLRLLQTLGLHIHLLCICTGWFHWVYQGG